ncbi:Non-classical phosphatidylinositol transfer protein (PITP) [Sporothrix curviconia]|uniref:Phosphatidylinositol transfer protein SFH5 n=1 Tax=Sporothrix curviconia TaxID=1260050 RepID=A0ABP0C3H6_9PEZI
MSDKPVETPAVEAKPAEAVADAPAAEAAPVEATPVEAAPVEAAAPAEAAPAVAEAPAAAPVDESKPADAAAAAAAPAAAEEKPAEEKPVEEKPAVTPIQALYAAAKEHGHHEIWGVTLADPATDVPSQIVFQKYLNANDGDLDKAKDQLLKTLEWRQKTKPLELLKRAYNRDKFGGLGYVTSYTAEEGTYDASAPETKEVFTWNVYGSTKNIDETFGNLQEFLDWRVALMELALQDLSLATATKAITADYDPYKIFQVHDYKSISFLRQSPHVKNASTQTIRVFAQNYPELLKEKFFVNVPAIMGFVYAFMKIFVAAKTIKKFHPMSNGNNLAAEFGASSIQGLGQRLPKEYGGKAGELKSLGKETELEDAPAAAAAVEDTAPAAKAEEAAPVKAAPVEATPAAAPAEAAPAEAAAETKA